MSSSKFFVGAKALTNNAGECSALVVFSAWIVSQIEEAGDVCSAPIVVHCGSTYVIGGFARKFKPQENIALAALVKRLWEKASQKLKLYLVWVKGHSNWHDNEHADSAAKCGVNAVYWDKLWTRRFV